jgi:hypothetical protein
MKRIYHHYLLWEDNKNGMYDIPCVIDESKINDCINLLSNPEKFYNTLKSVLNEWVISSDENLSNINCNRQAWLGQAACCYLFKAEETITRKAWGFLSDKKKQEANNIADKIIREYESKNKKIHSPMGKELLF